MENSLVLPRNLKPFLPLNYNWILSNGKKEASAKDQIKTVRDILNSIAVLKYNDFRKFLRIKKELGESESRLNSYIISVRQFARFLHENKYRVDAELLNYPTFW